MPRLALLQRAAPPCLTLLQRRAPAIPPRLPLLQRCVPTAPSPLLLLQLCVFASPPRLKQLPRCRLFCQAARSHCHAPHLKLAASKAALYILNLKLPPAVAVIVHCELATAACGRCLRLLPLFLAHLHPPPAAATAQQTARWPLPSATTAIPCCSHVLHLLSSPAPATAVPYACNCLPSVLVRWINRPHSGLSVRSLTR